MGGHPGRIRGGHPRVPSAARKEKKVSYTASVNGVFTIEPPLTWAEIRDSKFHLTNKPQARDEPGIVLDVERSEEETDTGISTIFTAKFAVPWRESFDCRNLEEDARGLVSEMAEIGRSVRGMMVVTSTEWAGDIWRVVIDDEGVRKEDARFVWPDGTDVQFN
jgi:hypothetical protein